MLTTEMHFPQKTHFMYKVQQCMCVLDPASRREDGTKVLKPSSKASPGGEEEEEVVLALSPSPLHSKFRLRSISVVGANACKRGRLSSSSPFSSSSSSVASFKFGLLLSAAQDVGIDITQLNLKKKIFLRLRHRVVKNFCII